MRQWIFIPILLILLGTTACSRDPAPESGLSVEDAWVRPPVTDGGNGAIYFRITNNGDEADTLLGVSSSVATAELHQAVMKENDVMSMEPMPRVEIPAGDEVEFKPGGMHVMLIEVVQPMLTGETIPFTLRFERAGEIRLTAEVRQD